MAKKKKLVFGAKSPKTAKTADDYLAQMPAYEAYRKFMQISMVGCLLCISGAVLLRINADGFDEIVLFLNLLAYVLVGSILFIWLSQLRPMRKKAMQAAKEFNAGLDAEATSTSESATPSIAVVDASSEPVLTDGAAKFGSLPSDPLYLKYRRIWRMLLALAAVMIVAASAILRVFSGDPGLALTVQVAAILPVAAAIYIYRIHLRPLKQKWAATKKD